MSGRFRAWVPNATGNLSFSLIGIDGQPTQCQSKHVLADGTRSIVARQRRNLSDNLLAKHLGGLVGAVHDFDFTMLAKTETFKADRLGVLRGWIFIHEDCPLDLGFMQHDDLDVRALKSQIANSALFGVAFRLFRSGRMELRVPQGMGVLDVRFGNEVRLAASEALRPLVAQCFYFLRDITHRHQHHANRSDTLTTVWPISDPSLWIRETLYELYRRVLMLRRQHSPRGQEDALGILAYVAAFESSIADPYRKMTEIYPLKPVIPVYEKAALKESLNANLETKRRKRVQRNVVAAIIPAFSAAMLSLGNAIYGRNAPLNLPSSKILIFQSFLSKPVTTSLAALATYEWLFPALLVGGLVWIAAFSGVFQPSEERYLKGFAQAAAVWGPARAALSMVAIALALLMTIIFLLRI